MNLNKEIASPSAFTTKRLIVRRYRVDDEANLFEAARESIEHVYPFLPWCHPQYSIIDAHDWLVNIEPEWQKRLSFSFAILHKQSGQLLGGCGLSRIDEHPVANLGYWIRSQALHQGIAAEATLGLVDFAFQELGFKRIEIVMSTKNEASRRVAEKAGGEFEGTLKSRLLIHGELHDAYLFSLVAPNQHQTSTKPKN